MMSHAPVVRFLKFCLSSATNGGHYPGVDEPFVDQCADGRLKNWVTRKDEVFRDVNPLSSLCYLTAVLDSLLIAQRRQSAFVCAISLLHDSYCPQRLPRHRSGMGFS